MVRNAGKRFDFTESNMKPIFQGPTTKLEHLGSSDQWATEYSSQNMYNLYSWRTTDNEQVFRCFRRFYNSKLFSRLSSRGRSEFRCGCKRTREQHSYDVLVNEETTWDREKHTAAVTNNAYGLLPYTNAPYIRCDIETGPEILSKLIFEVWQIKRPRLVMCVIGGAKFFKMHERLEREFINGIIQTTLKAGRSHSLDNKDIKWTSSLIVDLLFW